MRALLVTNYVQDNQESMQRFAAMLQSGLVNAGVEVRRITPPTVFGRVHSSQHGVGKWLGYVDKFCWFPRALRRAARWADVVHICDHSNSLYTRYLEFVPQVVTCHDMLAVRSAIGEIPQNPTSRTGRHLQRMIISGLCRAHHVTCVSNATREDLVRLTKISKGNTSLIYNALNYAYTPMDRSSAMNRIAALGIALNRPFLLHVGGNQWYKNRLGVLRIFHELLKHKTAQDFLLVMVGKNWTQEMEAFVNEAAINERIVRLSNVDNEDLRALYSTAGALLFPSLQEGFGWPIVEAQACGCLVFTSNRAPMNEIGGNAAVYFDPENVASAASVIARTLQARCDFRSRSIANATRFDSSEMIARYLNTYESLIGSKR